MKKSFMICVALCFVSSFTLFAQGKTVFHYPLNDGDLWEYWEGPRFFIYEQRKVIGDTLLSNGKIYKAIKVKGVLNSGFIFQRIEDHQVFQAKPRFVPPDSTAYDEFLLYKLQVELGDTWPYPGYGYDGFIANSGFVQVNEFGIQGFAGRNWKGMALGSCTLPDTGLWFDPDVILLDSLGVYADAYEGGYFQLRGAIINGQQFGTITSVNVQEAASNSLIPVVTSFRIFPNPVVSDAQVQFELTGPREIQFSIFDVLGRRFYQSPRRHLGVGFHNWPLNDLGEFIKTSVPNGVYFIVLTEGLNQRLVRKFIAMK